MEPKVKMVEGVLKLQPGMQIHLDCYGVATDMAT